MGQMLKKYSQAKRLELSTGFGDTEDIIKVKGKVTAVVKTATEQLIDICQVFKILDARLGERHANSISATMGIAGNGLRGAGLLLQGEGGESESESPESGFSGPLFEKTGASTNSGTTATSTTLDNVSQSPIGVSQDAASIFGDDYDESQPYGWENSLFHNSLQTLDSPVDL